MRGMYKLSVAPEDAPDESEHVDLAFEGRQLREVTEEAFAAWRDANAEQTGRQTWIGRVDIVENRFVGMKGRGVLRNSRRRDSAFRAPANGNADHGPRSHAFARQSDPEIQRARLQRLLVFARARSAPSARHRNATQRQRRRSSQLYKGNIIVAGRKSPKSLYDPKIATMEGEKSAYDQGDATGFIRLNALRLRIRAALTQARGSTGKKDR